MLPVAYNAPLIRGLMGVVTMGGLGKKAYSLPQRPAKFLDDTYPATSRFTMLCKTLVVVALASLAQASWIYFPFDDASITGIVDDIQVPFPPSLTPYTHPPTNPSSPLPQRTQCQRATKTISPP